MSRFAFVGPSYTSQAPNVDDERCVNMYPELVESQQGKSLFALYPRPGLKAFATLAGEPSVPQLFAQNGRVFAAGLFLWEVFANGTVVKRGNLNPVESGPIFITANQVQLLIVSNGNLYLMNLMTNVVTPVNMAQFNGPITWVGFSDGFFLALQANSQVFYVSNLLDGSTWQAVNAEQVSVFTDNIVSAIVAHRELALMGSKAGVVYYNSGAQQSPFVPISGAYIEQGSNALAGMVRADNSVFWSGQDERGALIFWRNNGYTPTRVSNHAVEFAWSRYPVTQDLIAYSFQDQGHTFVVLYFPTQSVTWVYDVATGMWHEWDFLDPSLGPIAHRSQCHCYAFGKHLVGDWKTGTVYQMDISFFDDFGHPIRRLRRAPHVATEAEWVFHHQLQLDLETGVGPMPPLPGNQAPTVINLQDSNGQVWQLGATDTGLLTTTPVGFGVVGSLVLDDNNSTPATTSWKVGVDTFGNLTTTQVPFLPNLPQSVQLISSPSGSLVWLLQVTVNGNLVLTPGNPFQLGRDPLVSLRWSDDGGHTWSNFYALGFGQAGKFKTRVIWRRLGRSRLRTYEITMSDPVPFRIVDAYLKATPGFQPTERLPHQVRKGA